MNISRILNKKESMGAGNNNSYEGKAIVILGPTGSGKTGVAIEVAKAVGGEIIAADSRTIYKGMDVGTAKPSIEEQAGVPHFGFDLVEPGERFTVADFKEYAEGKMREIRARGHVPIVCGGTGLYVDALVYDYHFKNDGTRSKINKYHRRDDGEDAPDRKKVCTNYLLIGVKWEREELRERLKMRVSKMFTQALFDETEWLVKRYGWGSQAMTSDIYQFAWKYMKGGLELDEAKELAFYDDWHLARRQMTWFKRTPEIIWLELEKICPFVIKCIQNDKRN